MITFPSINLLHTCTSDWIQKNQTKVKERQLQNQSKVKFKYFAREQAPNKRCRTNNACDECRRKKKKCSGGIICESCKRLSLKCSQGKQQQRQLYENKIKKDNDNDNDNDNHHQQQYNNNNNNNNNNSNNNHDISMDSININKISALDSTPFTTHIPQSLSSSSCSSISSPSTTSTSQNISIQIINQQNGIMIAPPPPPPPPPSHSSRSDANFPHYLIQKSRWSSDGQYFGGTSVFITDFHEDETVAPSPTANMKTPSQYLCDQGLYERDQDYLLSVYHANVDTLYPMFNLDYLKQQLHSSSTTTTSLSTLFFLALFIRASYLVNEEYSSQQGIKYGVLSTYLTVDFNLQRDKYLASARPTCATVLALTMMSNHMTFNTLRHQLPYAMNYNAEACSLALTLGLHASEPSIIDPTLYQLRLRTFWLTFITDYTLKTIHGRPYAIDEGDVDLDRDNPFSKHPDHIQCTKDDDTFTEIWLKQLKCTIDITKGIGRTVKFNYSPQRKRDQQHQYYIGYISSLDHWICEIANKKLSDRPDNTNTNQLLENVNIEEWKKRLEQIKKLYIYTSLMLIHKRFIDDESLKHGSRPSSLEICFHAAIEVIHLTYMMSKPAFESISTSPLTIYSLMMSLQLLQSLFMNTLQEDTVMVAQAEIQFEIGYSVLQQLMICHNPQSMIYHTLCHLWKKYKEYRTGSFQTNNHSHDDEILLHKPNAHLSTSTQVCHPSNAFISGSHLIPGIITPSSNTATTVAHSQVLTNNTTTTTTLFSSHHHHHHHHHYTSSPSSSTPTTSFLQDNSSSSSIYSHTSSPLHSSMTDHSQQQQWKIKECFSDKSIPTPTTSPSSSSSSSLHPL